MAPRHEMNWSRRKPTSCSAVPGSSSSESSQCATLFPFPFSFPSLPFLSSSFFFSFLLSFFPFLFFPPFFFSFPAPPSFSYELFVTSHLYKILIPCKLTHMACHVSCKDMHCDTWLAMCHLTPDVSKNVKFRLSRNSTKFV